VNLCRLPIVPSDVKAFKFPYVRRGDRAIIERATMYSHWHFYDVRMPVLRRKRKLLEQ
jgi:hypothetical protein